MDADTALQAYYERDRERDRLATGIGRVEFDRTLDIVTRSIAPAPAVVADIGGGPGRYTDFLVDQGYTVIHRDVVPHHVEQVAAAHGDRVDTAVGDARSLDLGNASVDAVLLLGPLYHLSDPADRALAIAEAARVTKPGGMIYGAAIAKWAARIQGVLVDRMYHEIPDAIDYLAPTEATGELPVLFPGSFTGNVHTAEQLASDFAIDGLALEGVFAIESLAAVMSEDMINERLSNDTDRAALFESLRVMETVPELLGVGGHLLAVARRVD